METFLFEQILGMAESSSRIIDQNKRRVIPGLQYKRLIPGISGKCLRYMCNKTLRVDLYAFYLKK